MADPGLDSAIRIAGALIGGGLALAGGAVVAVWRSDWFDGDASGIVGRLVALPALQP